MKADLHCHSTVSDGLLRPAELVRRAHEHGVELLALTDHDELDGLDEAHREANELGLNFVDGVEVSVTWGDDVTVHVLGLDIDPGNRQLVDALAGVRRGRDGRARRMAEELDKAGIHGAYEGALRFVGNPALISRAHFARHIVEQGLAGDFKSVFDHWLAKGKPGYVPHAWARLDEAVAWIHGAGGLAVIAHAGRCRLSATRLRELLAAFKDMGGEGIEVLSGAQWSDDLGEMGKLARHFGFLASVGSDFHGPGESWMDLGGMPALPDDLVPVWEQFKCMNHRDTETQR